MTTAALAAVVVVAGLGLFLALRARGPDVPASPPDPFGPIRPLREIRQNETALTGQMVRLRGRVTGPIRNLNPGNPFPWDVIYTVDDGTGTVPVRWFAQEQSPPGLKPPTLTGDEVIVTGKVKRELELEGKTYPLLVHEQPELHNQERVTLPVSPALP